MLEFKEITGCRKQLDYHAGGPCTKISTSLIVHIFLPPFLTTAIGRNNSSFTPLCRTPSSYSSPFGHLHLHRKLTAAQHLCAIWVDNIILCWAEISWLPEPHFHPFLASSVLINSEVPQKVTRNWSWCVYNSKCAEMCPVCFWMTLTNTVPHSS